MSAPLALLVALAADPADDAILTWQAPDGCPPVEVMRAQIRRSLAGIAVDPALRVRADVAISREPTSRVRLDLTLDLGDGPGERTLHADTCDAAVDTAAWLVAIALDVRAVDPATTAPILVPEAPPPLPEPPPRQPPPLQPPPLEPPDPPTPPAQPHPAPRLHLDLWAGGGLGLGLLPGATGVAAGGWVLSGPRWHVELAGHYWATRVTDFGDGVGGRFVHGHAALRGCGAWESGRVRVPLCAGLAAGGLTGQGTGAVLSRTARSPFLGLLAGAQLWLRLHARVRLVLQAEAIFGLVRPGFTLEPTHTLLFRPAPVGFSALLALAVRLR